jgi:triacylglycerol lipase
MRRMLVVAVLAAAALAPGALASANDPILFVHGWSESGTVWNTMIRNFEREGWRREELNNFSYRTSQSNVTTARDIESRIATIRRNTGAAKVDIITHSMGGLSSRYYIKTLRHEADVDEWVSLGGPNHGTTTASFCFETSCVEMRPRSAFLTALNEGDETPGAVNYGTWWSSCDSIINPDESVILAGARNTEAGCVEHIALTSDATVFRGVRDFVR